MAGDYAYLARVRCRRVACHGLGVVVGHLGAVHPCRRGVVCTATAWSPMRRKQKKRVTTARASLNAPSPKTQPGLTNLRGFKDLKDFVMSLEKPR